MPNRKASPPRLDLDLREEDLAHPFEAFDPLSPTTGDGAIPVAPAAAPADPIDWEYLSYVQEGFLRDILDHYFRGELVGDEKVPAHGPLILAPNHSGNAFPHDGIVFDGLMWRSQGFKRSTKCRSVFSPSLAATWWMRPYALDNWWRRAGGVDMTFANYDALLRRGDKVIYYPEGVPGIGKGFLKRYQLQHFYSSFVVLAARHDAPVYPISIVNAEWVNPTSVTFEPLNRLFDRLFRLPFFPVPIVFLAFLFPFIFYLAFPCRMVFVVNDAIDVRALLRAEGCPTPEEPARRFARRVAARIRQLSQQHLDAAVSRHGDRPYAWRDLARHMRSIRGRALRTTPLGWPFAYVRHDRDRERPPATNRLHAFLRDLDVWAFYLPLGWFVLALLRRLRKPPYGYRGLTKAERRAREGAYRWSLKRRPLPPRGE